MIGPTVVALGWLLVVVTAVLLWGLVPLGVAGVVMILVGLFVDLDSVRGPKRA